MKILQGHPAFVLLAASALGLILPAFQVGLPLTRFTSLPAALITLFAVFPTVHAASLPDDPGVSAQAISIVARQKGTFASPPILMPTRKVPDGPLLGNGDVGVAIGGVIERQKYYGLGEAGGANVTVRPMSVTNSPERHRFYLAKNDCLSLLQTDDGVMRVFPVWPREKPARFGRLRTHGAFLVSSELRDGEVESVQIESEHGRECVLQNPWPGRELNFERSGQPAEKHSDVRITFPTSPGKRIVIRP